MSGMAPAAATHSYVAPLSVYDYTSPPLPNAVFIRVDALEAALAQLNVTGITAAQLLYAVRDEESNLSSTPSGSEQTGAGHKRTRLHMYASNLN